MSVVCCKVACIRPAYKNLKEWMQDDKNIYIGRRGIVFVDKERYPKQDSPFCNPFKVGKDGTREEVIEKYRLYIKKRLKREPELKEQFAALKGKRLGCWCHPEACHGDVLLKMLEEL